MSDLILIQRAGHQRFVRQDPPSGKVKIAPVNTFVTIVLYLLAASAMLAFIAALKSLRLRKRFERLGVLPGRSVDEVIRFVGNPSNRSRLNPIREILEWRRVGYHIALSFSNGVCDGVERV